MLQLAIGNPLLCLDDLADCGSPQDSTLPGIRDGFLENHGKTRGQNLESMQFFQSSIDAAELVTDFFQRTGNLSNLLLDLLLMDFLLHPDAEHKSFNSQQFGANTGWIKTRRQAIKNHFHRTNLHLDFEPTMDTSTILEHGHGIRSHHYLHLLGGCGNFWNHHE